MEHKTVAPEYPRRFFLFLVVFRWASLVPGIWLLWQETAPARGISTGLVLAVAAGNVLLISAFYRPLNRWVTRRPYLLSIDLVFVAGLLAISGGARSPYYLYALSPLLAAAFFFQLRGALFAAGLFTPLYLAAALFPSPAPLTGFDTNLLFTQLMGIWLIPVLLSYPAILLQRLAIAHTALEKTGEELTQQNIQLVQSHRQLEIIHDLTTLLQAAPDVQSVQERVLTAVTGELGFPGAAVGLVDPGGRLLRNWQTFPQPAGRPSLPDLALDPESGPLVQDLLSLRPGEYQEGRALTADPAFNRSFETGSWQSFPLNLREHPVGVLLVQSPGEPEQREHFEVLEVVAGQAAVSLGTTMLCIDRAQRLAVEEERNRIARDIHDTVAQSLFGMVFTLDACVTMLPENAEAVRQELIELHELASGVRQEVRSSIFDLWPSELNFDRFKNDLRSYVSHCCRPRPFHVEFRTIGDFEQLRPAIRRNLYRVAQEALGNAARHSGAESAQLSMEISPERVLLRVEDDGQGFDPERVLARDHDHDRFGLHGIQERVRALHGHFEVDSRPRQGTRLTVNVPLQLPGDSAYG